MRPIASCSGTSASSNGNVGKGAGSRINVSEFVEFVFGAAFDSFSVLFLCVVEVYLLPLYISVNRSKRNNRGPFVTVFRNCRKQTTIVTRNFGAVARYPSVLIHNVNDIVIMREH